MCLHLRKKSETPHNKSNIRWKAVFGTEMQFYGPYRNCPYKNSGWNKARLKRLDATEAGFHVMVTRKGAEDNGTPKKIEVRGFLRSGTFDGYQCETWREFRFVN